ncbi:hypothetical protein SEA_LUCKYSOCKE_168 [Streptomyces phage LuckySocke]|nr:hypothetical protein SEA_LUCKYSOCKE_168 [Streptomyces phage LuckySocke]
MQGGSVSAKPPRCGACRSLAKRIRVKGIGKWYCDKCRKEL